MDYYKEYVERYMLASQELRDDAKRHWIECHKKNLAAKRDDLIIFSSKMLASITLADDLVKSAYTDSVLFGHSVY